MNIIAETKNYAVIKVPGGDQGVDDFETAMQATCENMEALLEKDYEPLHYVPRLSSWVCRKLEADEFRMLRSRVTQVESRMAAIKKNGAAGAS